MADWGRIGEVLGTGLGEGLRSLAEKRAQDMQRRAVEQERARVSTIYQNLGYSPQESQLLTLFQPDQQLKVLSLLGSGQQANPSMQESSGLKALTSQQPQIQQLMPQQEVPKQEGLKPENPVKKPSLREALSKPIKSPKEIQQERAHSLKEQQHADKETAKFYKETLSSARGADNNDRRLNRMETLVKTGKLTNPVFHSALNALEKGIFGFGINLHSLENPESQEFSKLSKEFLKDAKEIFGARITNLDVDTFLKMIPDLSQSDDGKLRIINNMRAYNEASRLRKKAMNDIIKENGGKRPLNLETLVEERVSPELDKLSQEFKVGYGAENKQESTSYLDQARKALGLL